MTSPANMLIPICRMTADWHKALKEVSIHPDYENPIRFKPGTRDQPAVFDASCDHAGGRGATRRAAANGIPLCEKIQS